MHNLVLFTQVSEKILQRSNILQSNRIDPIVHACLVGRDNKIDRLGVKAAKHHAGAQSVDPLELPVQFTQC